ncbi:MAG: hypothetical protein HYS44_00985 [Candidatus Niyogibacteria bacterium]|nr:hypothetical protein [Candidatus Niyogibacteria bacterium]
MPDAKDTIKEFIASGKRFFIASDPSFDEAALFASYGLKKILESAGKEVYIFPPVPEALAARYAPLINASANPAIPRKIKIRIPKSVALEEMRYDDEPDAISIVISPKTHLDIKDLLIERAPYEMDAAFCFFDDETQFEKMEAPIVRPPRERRIYLVRNVRTLAEKVWDIAQSSAGAPASNADTATLLFASLLAETDHLRTVSNPPAFQLAGRLLECGARAADARRLLARTLTPDQSQFLGRALARTTTDPVLNASWTFLSSRDFAKTNVSPSPELFRMIFDRIASTIGRLPIFILCYEQGGIRTLFAGDEQALRRTAERFGVLYSSGSVLAGPVFPTFSEAETTIRQLLKEGGDGKMQS